MKHDREAVIVSLGIAASLAVAWSGNIYTPFGALQTGLGVGGFVALCGLYLYLMLVRW